MRRVRLQLPTFDWLTHSAISVSSVPPCEQIDDKEITTETQRTRREHREKSDFTFLPTTRLKNPRAEGPQ